MSELYNQVIQTEELQNAQYDMKSHVEEMFDFQNAEIPEECHVQEVSAEEINKMIDSLELKHQENEVPESVEDGDSVVCRSLTENVLSDRSVILFPGKKLPGAEAAEEAVLGMKPGDEFETEIMDQNITLKVEKITRTQHISANDEMVRRENIEGINTLEEYREYCRKQIMEKHLDESARKLAGNLFLKALEETKFSVDEEEKYNWTMELTRRNFDAYDPEEAGLKEKLLADPEKLKEYLEEHAKEVEHSFYEYLLYREIASEKGIYYDIEKSVQVIMASAEPLGLDFEETMKRVNMHYLLNVCYMQDAIGILMDQMKKRLQEEN